MSLETAIAENTAALKDLITTIKSDMSLRSDVVKRLEAKDAGSKGAASTKKADEAKPNISTGEERKDPAETDPREGLRELVAKYLSGTDREDERTARKEKVKALLNHDKIRKPDVEKGKAKGADDIMDDAIETFKKNLNAQIEKGDITPAPKAADDDLV